MTASDALLDTSAWWEILHGTPAGRSLAKKHMEGGRRPHASALTLAELAAKLGQMAVPAERVEEVLLSVRVHGQVHPVSAEIAERGGLLRAELRKADASASLADAIVLATAQELAVPLVSNDAAFQGRRGVVTF